MVTIRGVYDGHNIRPLPAEKLPEVAGEIPVLITFMQEETNGHTEDRHEIARRMRAIREAMPPLGISLVELIEDGRER